MNNPTTASEVIPMKAVIRKWGNHPAVRLPVAVVDEANLNVGQRVSIVATCGRIVIEPAEVVEYELDELLAGITRKNLHDELLPTRTPVDWGSV